MLWGSQNDGAKAASRPRQNATRKKRTTDAQKVLPRASLGHSKGLILELRRCLESKNARTSKFNDRSTFFTIF